MPTSVSAFSFTEMGKGEDRLDEARNLFERGQADAANARLDEAIQHFENVLAKDGISAENATEAQENLGYCYWFRHQEERAMANWIRASVNQATKTRILAFLADAYNKASAEKNFSRSFTLNRYALTIDPGLKSEPIAVYTVAARQWLNKGQINIAKAYLDEVIWMDPGRRTDAARLLYESEHRFTQAEEKILICKLMLNYQPGWQNQAGEILASLGQTMDKSSFQSLIKRNFNQSFSAMVYEMAYPWREVYRQTFTGVGYTGGEFKENNGGGIKTLESGKEVYIGDQYTVIDNCFETWVDGKWRKFQQGEWLTVHKVSPGNYLAFRSEAGKKFTIVVRRK